MEQIFLIFPFNLKLKKSSCRNATSNSFNSGFSLKLTVEEKNLILERISLEAVSSPLSLGSSRGAWLRIFFSALNSRASFNK